MMKKRSKRTKAGAVELTEEQLNQVDGGLPAVQKVRNAATNSQSSDLPMEQLALNYTKITY